MNTIIEKIRAEVNKLPEKHKGKYKQFGNSLGFIDGLDMVKKILSDLEKSERPEPYNPVYDEAYLDKKIAKATKSWNGVDVDKMLAECRGYDEQPVCEGEEEAGEKYADYHPACFHKPIAESFKAGAKWQREQWEDRFNALEEAIKKRPVHDNVKDELKEFVLNSAEYALSDDRLLALAEHFVQWQKEQMMKEAVEGEVCGFYGNWVESEFLETPIGEEGDKVKLIIVMRTGNENLLHRGIELGWFKGIHF